MTMAAQWIEWATGQLDDKKRYRQVQARTKQLPEPYRAALEAVDRYLLFAGAITAGGTLVTMLEDLLELFAESAADHTPIRDIVGDDPVEFAETFLSNYADGQWIQKERTRLADAIDRAAATESGSSGRPRA